MLPTREPLSRRSGSAWRRHPCDRPPTPAMQQYLRMKAEHPGALLFFRMGDFYEMFLRGRRAGSPRPSRSPRDLARRPRATSSWMCGVPHLGAALHRSPRQASATVALREQVEDPRTAKGVVKREVVRVVTPGTQLEAGAVDASIPLVLAVNPREAALGAAWLDATTGEFLRRRVAGQRGLGPAARRAGPPRRASFWCRKVPSCRTG